MVVEARSRVVTLRAFWMHVERMYKNKDVILYTKRMNAKSDYPDPNDTYNSPAVNIELVTSEEWDALRRNGYTYIEDYRLQDFDIHPSF